MTSVGKIAIVTDSNSGITQEQAKEYGIHVLPMPFCIDEKTYFEDIDLTQEQFYEKLETIIKYFNFYDSGGRCHRSLGWHIAGI